MTARTSKQQTMYVALLRGINVGGNSRVEMNKLRELFISLGFEKVSTYINSGNVLFTSSKKPEIILRLIQKGLAGTFSFKIPIILRNEKSIASLVRAVPKKWQNDAEQRTDVLFLWDEIDTKSTLKDIEQNPEVDVLRYIPGVIVWHIERAMVNKSKMKKCIGTRVYKKMTARNINTVRKLAELMSNT